MSLRTYINRIKAWTHSLDERAPIRRKILAEKLDLSERWLYNFLKELKEEFQLLHHL